MGHQSEHWYDFKKKFKDITELSNHCKAIVDKFGPEQKSRSIGYYYKMKELQNL